MPMRLVEVSLDGGDKTGVRIVLGKEARRSYAALTYCWGRTNLMTTTENLTRHMDLIKISDLPQTIQDAIECVRRIGISYLWVDALCIVQNSESEMAQEISIMSQIYLNAEITISAALATDSSEGFLHDRPFASPVLGEIVPRLPFRCSDMTIGSVGLLKFTDTKFRDPISARGWTFQEHMLSRKLLIYGSLGVYWQCLEGNWPEEDRHASASRLSRGWITQTRRDLQSLVAGGDLDKKDGRLDWWENIVEEYSTRRLTYPEDKLPALSAIVATFRLRPNQYVAGLWAHEPVRSLLWMIRRPNHTLRLSPQVAPSWSWASIQGEVRFLYNRYELHRDENWRCVDPRVFVELIDVRCCEAVPKINTNPYGEIKYAWLRVRGYLRPVHTNNRKALLAQRAVAENSRADWDEPYEGVYLDSAEESLRMLGSFYSMPIARVGFFIISLLLYESCRCMKRFGLEIEKHSIDFENSIADIDKIYIEIS
jgi:hypothetical protein